MKLFSKVLTISLFNSTFKRSASLLNPLNRKPLVGIAVGILVVIIVTVSILPGSDFLKNIMPKDIKLPGSLSTISSEIKPLDVKLNDISILSVTEKEATLELKFDISNPNDKPILLEMISFNIFENNIKVGYGEIGERLAGQYASSNYYTVLSDSSLVVPGKITLKNTGNNPEFWSTLQQGTPQWRIKCEAFYSTTSAFSGIAGSAVFDFTR